MIAVAPHRQNQTAVDLTGRRVGRQVTARDPADARLDRSTRPPDRLTIGGSGSVSWYNGYMVSSEIARGLDILELTPSPFVSQNEIDAAKV